MLFRRVSTCWPLTKREGLTDYYRWRENRIGRTFPQDTRWKIAPCVTLRISFTIFITNLIISISSRFSENQLNEICSHLSEKASKGRFLTPEILQSHRNEGKGKEKKKERGEEKKSHVCTLSQFDNSYFVDSFWPKKTVRRKRSIWR